MASSESGNPQAKAESSVTAMWEAGVVQQARNTAASLFDLAYGRDTPAEARPTFDAAIDEYVTNYLFKAAASDACYPGFVRSFMPPHVRTGADIPGARMGGDNPDNVYRLVGITHGGSYRVTGKPRGLAPSTTSFTLVGNFGTSVTIGTIESHDLQLENDGSFAITIDGQPAGNRPNHLTSAPHVKFLFVRDSLSDWSKENPYDLQIERLDDAGRDPLTVEEMAKQAAFRLVEDVPLYSWFQRLFSGLPPNTMRPPETSGRLGGLVTQAGMQAWFTLQPEEVVLLRFLPAGAAYAAVQLTDWWFRSIDAHKRPSSLTRDQTVLGADGWIECVISPEDPGYANWLDTGGLSTVLFLGRWQGLNRETIAAPPWISLEVLNMDELKSRGVIAGGTVSAQAQEQRIRARQASWQRRVDLV